MKNPSKLKLGHINVYHIQQKLHDVSLILDTNALDIFGLSETKLTESHPDTTLHIPTYTFFRKNKSVAGEAGIIVYVKDNLAPFATRRTDLECFGVECIWIEIKFPKNPPIMICNLYRNGKEDGDWFYKFADMMDKIKITEHEIVIMGDFNINLLNPHTFWESTLSIYNLKQQIQTPTRLCNTTATLIDHIYTNSETKMKDVHVSNSGISDHFPIFCTHIIKENKPVNNDHIIIETRSFKHFNTEDFLTDLSNCNFKHIYNEMDPNKALQIFYEIFIPLLDKHAPIVKRRIKQRIKPGWLTPEIIEQMEIRDKLSKNKVSPDYKKQRNKVTSLVRKAKKAYFNKVIESNESIAILWRITNQLLGKTTNNKTSNTTTFTATQFNEYFTELSTNLIKENYGLDDKEYITSSKLESFIKDRNVNENFQIPLLREEDTFKYINHLKNKKSSGTDKVNVFFLKLALPYINTPLTHIYNASISNGIFPDKLKEAKVIPIHKSKNAKDLNNFRPISLLNILSKPLEKHIHKHIYNFLDTNNLFHKHQSGFRKKHSCHTASIRIIDTWLNNINKDFINGAVFLDLRKAFDLVNHEILIKKLRQYLPNPLSISLLQSYLSNRTQLVSLNGSNSNYKNIPCGVPQGSILGPLLFCIYINDLPLHITNPNVFLDLFADDSSLHTSSKSIDHLNKCLQTSLDEIQYWCKDNKMLLHPDKTKSMIITTRQKRQLHDYKLNLKVNKCDIEQVVSHKVLGIIIDQNLSWEEHINHLCKILSQNLFLLSKLKHYLNSFCLKLFFNAHILSRINYSNTVWHKAADDHILKVESLYKRGIKMISEDKNISTVQKTKNLNLLSLKNHFFFNSVCLTFKIQNDLAPNYLTHFINMSNRNNSLNMIVPLTRLDKFKMSYCFTGPTNWNQLPKSIRNIDTIGKFKTAVKNYLL